MDKALRQSLIELTISFGTAFLIVFVLFYPSGGQQWMLPITLAITFFAGFPLGCVLFFVVHFFGRKITQSREK